MNVPLKTHGGKAYLAPKLWEIARPILPDIKSVVEAYCGGCAFTLEGLAQGIEKAYVVNDINLELSIFWRVIASDHCYKEFMRIVKATPFSEKAWQDAVEQRMPTTHELSIPAEETAANFFIRCRQSLAGRGDTFAAITKSRLRRNMQEQVSAWLTAVDGLPEVHAAMSQVLVLNRPALAVIRAMDHPQTLFYLDPPYVHEARSTTKEYGEYEMSDADHIELLDVIADMKGKFMLSGYDNKLYDSMFKDFPHTRHEFDMPNNSAGGKKKERRKEVVWCNF